MFPCSVAHGSARRAGVFATNRFTRSASEGHEVSKRNRNRRQDEREQAWPVWMIATDKPGAERWILTLRGRLLASVYQRSGAWYWACTDGPCPIDSVQSRQVAMKEARAAANDVMAGGA